MKKINVIITFPFVLLIGIVWGIWFGITLTIDQARKIWRLGGGWNNEKI